jgi:hypothetical protein
MWIYLLMQSEVGVKRTLFERFHSSNCVNLPIGMIENSQIIRVLKN